MLAWLSLVLYLAMCETSISLIPCGNHAQLRGGSVVEILRITLAYGWVERCSDIAGCRELHSKISILSYFISAIVFNV